MQDLYKSDQFNTYLFENRAEWLDYRIRGVGGSDSSCVLGLNPYKTNVELYLEKIRDRADIQADNRNSAMQYGTDAEDPLRRLFALSYPQYEVQFKDNCIVQSKELEFMIYSPDGFLLEKETGLRGIYEGKTTDILSSMQKESWKDKVPQNYFVQILHGLAITNYDFAIINVEFRFRKSDGTQEFVRKIYRFNRVDFEEDIKYLKSELSTFWKHVQQRTQPNLKVTML